MLKSFIQILIIILALVYVGGRVGILGTQIRNAKKSKLTYPPPQSNLPDSIWVAQEYARTIACDTFGLVHIGLKLKDRTMGWMQATHGRTGKGHACKFNVGFNFRFEQDHISIKYPLGTLDEEARCPSKCRYSSFLRTKFIANYQDTIIHNKEYQILQFPGFIIKEL